MRKHDSKKATRKAVKPQWSVGLDLGDRSSRYAIVDGDVRLRRLLVQCAHRILGPFGCDSSLRRWAQQLASRGGPAGRKRAVTALARKLAVVPHRLWARSESRRPFAAEA